MDYQLGFILGFAIIVGLGISLVLLSSSNKDNKIRTKYDERQKIARGKSYMYGFSVMLITSAILMLAHLCGAGHFLGCYGYFITIIVGVIVQTTHAVFHDAYIGLNTNINKYMISMGIIAIINAASAVSGIIEGEMIVDGALDTPFMNLLCTVLFLVLLIDFGIKKLIDKKDN